jgi:hypothetical protein
MWQNLRAYRTITNNPCPHINDELLLVYRMAYAMRILLRPLVLVVNIDDAATTPESLNGCDCLLWGVKRRALNFMEDILSTYYKCTLKAITHKLNVSGHICWYGNFFLVLACAIHAQSFPAHFTYTLYNREFIMEYRTRRCWNVKFISPLNDY